MKPKKSLKPVLASAVLGTLLGASTTLLAAPSINGVVEFVGGATLNGPLGTATAFTSIFGPSGTGDPLVRIGATGSYSGVAAGTPTHFTLFSFNPSAATPFTLWNFTVGATVYSFDVTSLSISSQTSSFLDLEGTGVAHISGYEDTVGSWSLTDTGAGTSRVFSFGEHTTVVPEPSTAVLMMAAFGGLMFTIRNKVKA